MAMANSVPLIKYKPEIIGQVAVVHSFGAGHFPVNARNGLAVVAYD